MRVTTTGGRDYKDFGKVYAILDAIHNETPIEMLRAGDATGADDFSLAWAEDRGVKWVEYKADWRRHGKKAGPLRNQTMIDAGADLVVAFPGGRGTADCVSRAHAAGIPVKQIV